ncbi:MAG: YlxR family protein [Ruminococcaceae bacterium]|nr:YlxR family protein [Oscillospiraceae bacterium]
MKLKKIPLRHCMGCNEEKPKNELIRVVRSPEGEISIDLSGKKSGRGAYICKDIQCLQKAIKSKRIDRSLSCTIDNEIYQRMEAELSENQ